MHLSFSLLALAIIFTGLSGSRLPFELRSEKLQNGGKDDICIFTHKRTMYIGRECCKSLFMCSTSFNKTKNTHTHMAGCFLISYLATNAPLNNINLKTYHTEMKPSIMEKAILSSSFYKVIIF